MTDLRTGEIRPGDVSTEESSEPELVLVDVILTSRCGARGLKNSVYGEDVRGGVGE